MSIIAVEDSQKRLPMKSFQTHSAEETTELGRKLAAEIKPGSVVLLRGELGAGKTTLVKGIAEGFAAAEGFRDLVVQATNVGMASGGEGDPAPGFNFTGKEIVYDLIYSPPMTRFLQRAQKAGCRILKGEEMLLAQAMEQFRLYAGSSYPVPLEELRIDSRQAAP